MRSDTLGIHFSDETGALWEEGLCYLLDGSDRSHVHDTLWHTEDFIT